MLAHLQAQRILHATASRRLACHPHGLPGLRRSDSVRVESLSAITWLAGGYCLHGVEATLLGTLQARAAEQRRRTPLIHDELAGRILARLGFEPKAEPTPGAYRRAVLRSATIDRWVDAFLAQHPNGTVIELGVGLNTRFERIARHRGTWIELDLPRVIQLREHVTEPDPRRHQLAGSMVTSEWLDVVAALPGPYCLVAEAVLGYLPSVAVRWLLQTIGQRFTDATVIFDTHPKWGVVEGERFEQIHDGIDRQAEVVASLTMWLNRLTLREALPLVTCALAGPVGATIRQMPSSTLTRWTASAD